MGEKTKLSDDMVRLYKNLRHNRGTWEGHWREVAKYVYPQADDFWQEWSTSSKGEKKSQFIYDATAMLANSQFASVIESLTVPRDQQWHTLVVTDPVVMKDRASREWLDEATRVLFKMRYRAQANFQTQLSETFMSIGAFGTGAIFTDQWNGGTRYKSCFIGDMYFDVNHQGIMDTAFRRFDFSHHQAAERWGDNAPEEVLKQLEDNPFQRSSYVHVVVPNDFQDPTRKDFMGMPFLSVYIHLESGEELERGGYRSMPYSVGRYQTSPHELYGRGPAMAVLPDIRTLNEMARADLRATHKLVDPPLLVHDNGIVGAGKQQIFLDPGMINFGGVSPEGRQLIQPLQTGARVDLNEAKMEVKRNVIKEAFLINTFQILQETPRMTATEVINRAQEKAALLGPIMGRVQSELISPIIDRELEIAANMGLLPDPPDMIVDAMAQGQHEIVYESPLNRLQRAESLQGIDMLIQMAVQLANVGQQEVLTALDGEKIMRHVQDAGGAPEDVIRTEEQIQQIQAAQAAQQQQAQAVEAAPQMAAAQKDLAQAEQIQGGI